MTRIAPVGVAVVAALLVIGTPSLPSSGGENAEVVVLLSAPPLARSPGTGERIDAEQHAFREELTKRVPSARVGWRYRLVANGFSVSLPEAEVSSLEALPGVSDVLPVGTYAPQVASTAEQIGAPALWGETLDTAGQGVKIGIIDSGVDPSHPFFDPAGYTMPAGFPKGQRRFTTAKVIVARSFPPKGTEVTGAQLAFDKSDSSHGTHVAGIAAGNLNTPAETQLASGVAPRAYIGNYKVFVQTATGLSPNANSPAIVAAIEAAVADGMDVINFSGGEPELEPSRDIVARALDAAAAAGVVPVVAAGNDYSEVGAGSVSSPSSAADAISVGAVDTDETPNRPTHASFSSVGPTTVSLRLKPDVAAPGVSVLSSVPGGWASFSGTSMAAPHVAGAAALLVERHPRWTVAQVKSALVQTGVDALTDGGLALGPRFQGGGLVALTRADRPLLFTKPTALSFGLMARGTTASSVVRLDDAGAGSGTWRVTKVVRGAPNGAHLDVSRTVNAPGTLTATITVAPRAAIGDLEGYIRLQRGREARRIPFWAHVSVNALGKHVALTLEGPGVFRGTTARQPATVVRYRYPENPRGVGVTTALRGPERVYRLVVTRPVANFGVVITRRGPGSAVEPRVVAEMDENRLTGYAGLPLAYNPYLDEFASPILAAGALSPAPGEYSVVFDSATRADAGSFAFRYWVDDVTPPTLALRTKTITRGQPVQITAKDAGAGVYGKSIVATIDGSLVANAFRNGVISLPSGNVAPGTHRLRIRVSDFQEAKNTENVARILPNTRFATFAFRVR